MLKHDDVFLGPIRFELEMVCSWSLIRVPLFSQRL